MAEKRRGLGRGLGALIPSAPTGDARPVDVFFPGATTTEPAAPTPADDDVFPGQRADADASGADGRTERLAEAAVRAPHVEPARVQGNGSTGSDDETAGPRPVADSGAPAEDAGGTQAEMPDAAGTDLPEGLLPVPGAHFAELPVTAIVPNPRQPRTVFDEDALAELVGSIREIGVLQPVVVRRVGDEGGQPRYELIMGERRWRATQEAGLSTIPAIVRDTEDEDLLRDALLENLHRSQLNPLEEAAAYEQLLQDFGCTHDELARRIHRSRPQISNTIRLLRLPPLVQRRVAAGVLSAGHARALLGLPDSAAMERLAQRIVAEGLSVRATEEIVSLGGDEVRPVVRRPRPGDRNAALDDLASRLSDRFETRVKIALGKSKGRLTVEFASVQDLNRILEVISPEDPGVLR